MAKDKATANYEPPASQVDLADRLERDNESRRKVSTAPGGRPQDEDDGQARDYGENAGDPEYLGTDVMYQNHANDTEKPGRAEGGDNPEELLEDEAYGESVDSSDSDTSSTPASSTATLSSSSTTE